MSTEAVTTRGTSGLRSAMHNRGVLVAIVVGIPLSGLFLWLAFRDADLHAVWSVLSTAETGPVVLAVAAMGGVYVGQAVRWRVIAQTPSVPTRTFFEMVVSGVAVNNVLPGRIGDFLRARWLQVAARIPGGRALATVFVDRVFDVLALVIFLAVSLPFVASADWLRWIALGGLALLAFLLLILVAARIYTQRRARDRRGERPLIRRLVRDTLEGLSVRFGPRRAAVLTLISLSSWTIWAVAAWLVARSLGIEFSLEEAIFVTAVINLGVAIPSSPGFIGTYQWLAVAALSLFDVGTTQALAFSVLMQAVWYVPTTLVGGAFLVRRGIEAARATRAARVPLLEARDA